MTADADELAALRIVARGLCHDVKSFLTAVSICRALGVDAEDPAELREALTQIGEAEGDCRRRIETFGGLVAGTLVAPLPGGGADLAAAAGAAIEAIEPVLRRSGATAATALASAPAALPPDRALALALLLALGGAQLLEGREGARLTIATATATDGRTATLRVEVAGAAIDAGPGLAGAKSIAEAAGGSVSARSEGGVFTAAATLPAV